MELDPAEGGTINEILLTAKEEEPWVKFNEGECFKIESSKDVKVLSKCTFNFPKAKRSHVEHFCWRILSFYLNTNPLPYESVNAMHNMLCAIVFYLLEECNKDDWKLDSLFKLADEKIYMQLIGHATGQTKIYHFAFLEGFQSGTDQILRKVLRIFEEHGSIKVSK